jgi:hypothetical protein
VNEEKPTTVDEQAASLQREHAVNVEIGRRSIQEQFLPAFLKEVHGMHPDDRIGVWLGFMSASLGAMAAELGVETTQAVIDGVMEGVRPMVTQLRAKQPGALLNKLITDAGYNARPDKPAEPPAP